MIQEFFNWLKNLNTFSPCEETNTLFTELCKYCVENDINIEVNDMVLEINKFCSIWEYELEKYYSKIISKSINPNNELKNFIYYDNYFNLTNFEYINLKYFLWDIKNILFIWWWPLPLTSIILAQNYNIKSKIIDISEEACFLSQKLINALWLSDMITIEKADCSFYIDDSIYDVCYAASLIFWVDNQELILKNISKLNFNKLLTRTSDWTRQLLYKKTNEDLLKKYFKIDLKSHPKNEIINSIIILSKK